MWYVVNFLSWAESTRSDVSSNFVEVDLSYVLVDKWKEVPILKLRLCQSWNLSIILPCFFYMASCWKHGLQVGGLRFLGISNCYSFCLFFAQSLILLSWSPGDVNSFWLSCISLNIIFINFHSGFSYWIWLSHPWTLLWDNFVCLCSFLTYKLTWFMTRLIIS